MLTRMTQAALKLACHRGARDFQAQRLHLEAVQRGKLQQLLQVCGAEAGQSWEQWRDSHPLTRYEDWRTRIDAQLNGESALTRSPLVRYQPTSGSSSALKLIPYTRAFLQELDHAIAPWLDSLYRQHPGLGSGTHYWSVSWLPRAQQQTVRGNLNDDSELLGGVKRWLAAQSQAVPAGVAMAGSADDALFATLCYLVADGSLRLLSVWSPTFALQLLDALPRWGDEVAAVLGVGHWGGRSAALQLLPAPYAPRRVAVLRAALSATAAECAQMLWPELAVVSAWDTADAVVWARQLRARLPQAAFEGKGLWATEGVVTIPVDGCYPLAYQSHVYEFERLDGGAVLAPWELREGDEVSPVLSGGNGLQRYRLDDRVVVSGFWGSVPCLQFLGRRSGTDLVGEKLSPETARSVLASVAAAYGVQPVTLLAVEGNEQGERPVYLALFAGDSPRQEAELAKVLDTRLQEHFHYALARELRQLAPLQVRVVRDGWDTFQRIAMAAGMIEGNIKPEPLKRVSQAAVRQVLPVLAEVA